MSDELELAAALREATKANREMMQVNAVGIASRNSESAAAQKNADRVSRLNVRTNALQASLRLKPERTPEQVIEDAEKFVEWITEDDATPSPHQPPQG